VLDRLRRQFEPVLAVAADRRRASPRLGTRAAFLVPRRQATGDVQLLATVAGVLVVLDGLAGLFLSRTPLLLRGLACLLLRLAPEAPTG
jgi:hypothetical protein